MTIFISLFILAVAAVALIVFELGVYNAIDRIALALHRFAVRGRAREQVHSKDLSARWAREVSGV